MPSKKICIHIWPLKVNDDCLKEWFTPKVKIYSPSSGYKHEFLSLLNTIEDIWKKAKKTCNHSDP